MKQMMVMVQTMMLLLYPCCSEDPWDPFHHRLHSLLVIIYLHLHPIIMNMIQITMDRSYLFVLDIPPFLQHHQRLCFYVLHLDALFLLLLKMKDPFRLLMGCHWLLYLNLSLERFWMTKRVASVVFSCTKLLLTDNLLLTRMNRSH